MVNLSLIYISNSAVGNFPSHFTFRRCLCSKYREEIFIFVFNCAPCLHYLPFVCVVVVLLGVLFICCQISTFCVIYVSLDNMYIFCIFYFSINFIKQTILLPLFLKFSCLFQTYMSKIQIPVESRNCWMLKFRQRWKWNLKRWAQIVWTLKTHRCSWLNKIIMGLNNKTYSKKAKTNSSSTT